MGSILTILRVKNLNKAFGGLQATSNVNYEMKAGEFSAIIGPNGAGKSTFFNLITGYHKCDSGRIFFQDHDITGLQPHIISKFGIARAFQVSNIYSTLTTFENVRQAVLSKREKTLNFVTPAKKLANRETLSIIESCGLTEVVNTQASKLSQGDKKRLELGVALGNNPSLLLLDEPTAGMSGEETRATMDFIHNLNRDNGLSILFTEHDMSVVFGYAKRITVLHQGEIIADGLPQDVKADEKVQRVYLGEQI